MINSKFFMLCEGTVEDEASKLDDESWTANIKFDGERMIAVKEQGDVILVNRRGKICNLHFPEIVEQFKADLPEGTMVDGEIISLNDDFTKLQSRALTSKPQKIKELITEVPVNYVIFDLIKNKGKDIRFLELADRIVQMKDLFSQFKSSNIKLAEFKSIAETLKTAREQDREGIVIKDLHSNYEHRRSQAWKKLKFFCEGEMTLIKYEPNPKGIRAEDKDGNAVQIAGEQHKEVKDLLDQKREVTITIQYLEKTPEGRYRFPSYRGIKENGI